MLRYGVKDKSMFMTVRCIQCVLYILRVIHTKHELMNLVQYLIIPFAHGGITTSFTLTPSVRTPRSKFWNGTKWNQMDGAIGRTF